MIYIASKSLMPQSLQKKYPNATIYDLTSKAEAPWQQFSPFYPHGGVPVPFSPDQVAASVEGIWQGLKVFENEGISMATMQNTTMKGIKRTVRKYGKTLGHQKGLFSKELLGYIEARQQIYLPTYLWVLQNKLHPLLAELDDKRQQGDLVFLDYETNTDPLNPKSPLSHAALVRAYLEGTYPIYED